MVSDTRLLCVFRRLSVSQHVYGPRDCAGHRFFLGHGSSDVVYWGVYPLAMELVGRSFPLKKIAALGWAAALNTVGNIIGVLIGAFVSTAVLRVSQVASDSCCIGVMFGFGHIRRSQGAETHTCRRVCSGNYSIVFPSAAES